jgi:hypothetical protein
MTRVGQTSGSLIRRNYSDFKGVDFSNRKDEIFLYRTPDALNMWKNYKATGGKSIETRPDVELLKEYSNAIFGHFFYEYNNKTHEIVHSGTNLYDDDNVIYEEMAEHKSHFFVFNNKLYIKDATNYLVYDGNTCTPVVGFIPTTTIGRSPAGGGSTYQPVNLLSPYRKNGFVADGSSTEYKLDAEQIDGDVRAWITDEDGHEQETTAFTVNTNAGIVTFTTAPSEPLTTGQDNVIIQYKKEIEGYADRINKCTLVEMFDMRVFVSGNPDYPNGLFNCERNDPTYFSDYGYVEDGSNDSNIKSLVTGNNALWVLKEPSQSNTTIFYHNPVIDYDDNKLVKGYPSVHSSISTGCKTLGVNFNDTICFFSDRGLEGITGDVTTEQTLSHKSSFVDNRLLNEEHYDDMLLAEWEGYLLTIIDNKIYLADSRQLATVTDHIEYEWYYFELNQKVTNATVKNGILYLCTEEKVKENGQYVDKYRIYSLTNNSENRNVKAYWTTIEDEFNYPQYQKTTNKKGCVVDVEGKEVKLYVKTDNKSFEYLSTLTNTKGYVVPRIKKKKWKSIQLKFESNKPLSVFSSTLEAYVGSYVKR